VLDDVIAEHVASFEPPSADENPIVIAAGESRDPRRLATIASAIVQG